MTIAILAQAAQPQNNVPQIVTPATVSAVDMGLKHAEGWPMTVGFFVFLTAFIGLLWWLAFRFYPSWKEEQEKNRLHKETEGEKFRTSLASAFEQTKAQTTAEMEKVRKDGEERIRDVSGRVDRISTKIETIDGDVRTIKSDVASIARKVLAGVGVLVASLSMRSLVAAATVAALVAAGFAYATPSQRLAASDCKNAGSCAAPEYCCSPSYCSNGTCVRNASAQTERP